MKEYAGTNLDIWAIFSQYQLILIVTMWTFLNLLVYLFRELRISLQSPGRIVALSSPPLSWIGEERTSIPTHHRRWSPSSDGKGTLTPPSRAGCPVFRLSQSLFLFLVHFCIKIYQYRKRACFEKELAHAPGGVAAYPLLPPLLF